MRIILFTGKSGAEKTSAAIATALRSMLDRTIERIEEPGEKKGRKRAKIEVQ